MDHRDKLIQEYATDLKTECGIDPDMNLLVKITEGLGPAIYNADAALVAADDQSELDTIKKNFLQKKLELEDGPELDQAIDKVIEQYGRSKRNKYRAVVYYLLTTHFDKASVYL